MEINKSICKICNKVKDRIEAGKFNSKDKKWVDEEGKVWNGRVCNFCTKERVKNHMKNKRTKCNT